MARLARITGHAYSRTDRDPKVRVVLETDPEVFGPGARRSDCRATIAGSTAVIHVSARNFYRQPLCIDHEMMHVFGFHHHPTNAPSVMSPGRYWRPFGRWDTMAILALMSPSLSDGMPGQAVLARLRAMLPDLRARADALERAGVY